MKQTKLEVRINEHPMNPGIIRATIFVPPLTNATEVFLIDSREIPQGLRGHKFFTQTIQRTFLANVVDQIRKIAFPDES